MKLVDPSHATQESTHKNPRSESRLLQLSMNGNRPRESNSAVKYDLWVQPCCCWMDLTLTVQKMQTHYVLPVRPCFIKSTLKRRDCECCCERWSEQNKQLFTHWTKHYRLDISDRMNVSARKDAGIDRTLVSRGSHWKPCRGMVLFCRIDKSRFLVCGRVPRTDRFGSSR